MNYGQPKSKLSVNASPYQSPRQSRQENSRYCALEYYFELFCKKKGIEPMKSSLFLSLPYFHVAKLNFSTESRAAWSTASSTKATRCATTRTPGQPSPSTSRTSQLTNQLWSFLQKKTRPFLGLETVCMLLRESRLIRFHS